MGKGKERQSGCHENSELSFFFAILFLGSRGGSSVKVGEKYRMLWKELSFIFQWHPGHVYVCKRIANKMDFLGWLYVIYKSQKKYQAMA